MFLYCSIIDTYLILRLFTCFRTNIFLHWYLLLRINKYAKIYLSDFYFWVWLLKNDPFSSGFDRSLWALLLNISNKLLFIHRISTYEEFASVTPDLVLRKKISGSSYLFTSRLSVLLSIIGMTLCSKYYLSHIVLLQEIA